MYACVCDLDIYLYKFMYTLYAHGSDEIKIERERDRKVRRMMNSTIQRETPRQERENDGGKCSQEEMLVLIF